MRTIQVGGVPVLPAAHRMGNSAQLTATGLVSNNKRVFGDLISYQDHGKGCAVIVDKVRKL